MVEDQYFFLKYKLWYWPYALFCLRYVKGISLHNFVDFEMYPKFKKFIPQFPKDLRIFNFFMILQSNSKYSKILEIFLVVVGVYDIAK